MSRTVESIAVNLASKIDSIYAENVSLVYALNGRKEYIAALHARGQVRVRVAELLIEHFRRGPETGAVCSHENPLDSQHIDTLRPAEVSAKDTAGLQGGRD